MGNPWGAPPQDNIYAAALKYRMEANHMDGPFNITNAECQVHIIVNPAAGVQL